ncbi:hypothetical protein H1230_19105 [Paenibacillus sp. 19GGS1-52]|uniref:hypothetical protein n=1 Tax=Paenibacillus sp. 19GGS1-52 TaxID=2758563 RepID=UPI001EFA9390|nr:hypothetical protein [Paenibacillus sp. 19GGS1-52]ULO05215.1 hypothetical protein H1230_19105 [Paenibacillus sp. 19GGS1-52]
MEEVYILNRPTKLLSIIAGVVFLNITVLSPGLLGVEIGGESTLETAAGITLLFSSLLVVLYGSYTMLFKPPAVKSLKNLNTPEDYIAELTQYRNVKVLKNEVSLAIDQLERIEKKKSTLLNVLGQRFDPTELSYRKFESVIHEVQKLFYLNIKGILNNLSVFDASEYSLFANQQKAVKLSDQLVHKKTELYKEYFGYISGYVGANEEILLKLDQLLLEISLLDNTDYKVIEDMPCMKEIDALIKQTKLYQQ